MLSLLFFCSIVQLLYHFFQTQKNGGRSRTRTCDLLRVKEALSPLSYAPTVYSLITLLFTRIRGINQALNDANKRHVYI